MHSLVMQAALAQDELSETIALASVSCQAVACQRILDPVVQTPSLLSRRKTVEKATRDMLHANSIRQQGLSSPSLPFSHPSHKAKVAKLMDRTADLSSIHLFLPACASYKAWF